MARSLSVYFNNKLAGILHQDQSGRLSFSYDPHYLRSKKAYPLSISMPLREGAYEDSIVRPFFSNLLPDDLARSRIAKYLGVSEKNPFAILEIIGGECAGALSLYPEGQTPPPPRKKDYEFLDNQKLEEILNLLSRRPLLAGEKDIRISLAGAQDKLAVAYIDNKIAIAKGTSPTTHILKPPISDIPDSVFNEYFCMVLAKRMNIPVASAEIKWTSKEPYLLIERYDRDTDDHHRLHQEDFCQALSIPPELKYQNEGGPSLKDCINLIEKYSVRPALDTITFLRTIIFNYLLGNADAHAKNFSFLYKEGKPRLAPAYDLICTAVYSQLSSKMAMKIGGKDKAKEVFLRHWFRLIPDTQIAKKAMEKDLKKFSSQLPVKSLGLLRELDQSGLTSPIYTQIHEVIEDRCLHISKYFL